MRINHRMKILKSEIIVTTEYIHLTASFSLSTGKGPGLVHSCHITKWPDCKGRPVPMGVRWGKIE